MELWILSLFFFGGLVATVFGFLQRRVLFLALGSTLFFVLAAMLWTVGYDSSVSCDSNSTCNTITTIVYDGANNPVEIQESVILYSANNSILVRQISIGLIAISILLILYGFWNLKSAPVRV